MKAKLILLVVDAAWLLALPYPKNLSGIQAADYQVTLMVTQE